MVDITTMTSDRYLNLTGTPVIQEETPLNHSLLVWIHYMDKTISV